MITIVSGFGRCGSSLVMQMFNAGGMQCSGEYPMFEADEVVFRPETMADWIGRFDGGVLKWLSPFDRPLPALCCEGFVPTYRAVWLDRDLKQQTLSWSKYMQRRFGAESANRRRRAQFAQRIKDGRKKSLAHLEKVAERVCVLSYERILLDPLSVAATLRDLVGRELDLEAMASVVVPRTAQCRDGFLEDELYAKAHQDRRATQAS